MQEGLLGKGKDIYLTQSLDTWDPRARGSSARVFLGNVRNHEGHRRRIAIKFMRPDKVAYATPMFQEEVRILRVLAGVRGVMRMTELGYLRFDNPEAIPPDEGDGGGRALTGAVHRFQPEESEQFLSSWGDYLGEGWLPYLGLWRVFPEDNLLRLCDRDLTRGRLFPVSQGLQVAVQACEILEQAHAHNIVYRDHKIIHYYWHEEQVTVIDWNVGLFFPEGVPASYIHHDLMLFAASALYYIFTGRAHPGVPAVGPTTPEQLEHAPDAFNPYWKYADRKRLKKDLRAVLEKALLGAYTTAASLKQDLQVFITHEEGE